MGRVNVRGKERDWRGEDGKKGDRRREGREDRKGRGESHPHGHL